MTEKKRTWKFWTIRAVLILLILGGIWLTNLIWFKPFNINHFYEKVFVELLLDSPELSTRLGIPIIADLNKDKLDDISDAKLRENFNKLKEDYQTLMSYDFESQSPENQLNTSILAYYMKMNSIELEPFFYHNYPVNQMFGIQSDLPSLLVSAHKLDDESGIEAYISRLSKFDIKFDQLIENLKIRESKGIIPPKFINTIVLNEMKGFVGAKSDTLSKVSDNNSAVTSNILYTNIETKLEAVDDLSDDEKTAYKKEVADAIENSVFPAYESLISYFEKLNNKATNDAGVWKLPNGDAYYRYMLKLNTTTDLEPEEVHQMGLSEVERIKKEMNAILESESYADSTKTLGEIIQKMNSEARFSYPTNDEGREQILEEYRRILAEVSQGIDQAFTITPKANLDVKRVPQFKEEGAAFAYYEAPALDGSRGGIFFANLRDPI